MRDSPSRSLVERVGFEPMSLRGHRYFESTPLCPVVAPEVLFADTWKRPL